MYVLVAYAIISDKVRTKVLKHLRNFGERIQLSAFECDLDEAQFTTMKDGVEKLIDGGEDRVRYYRLCKGCTRRVVISGWGEIREDEGFEVI